MNDKYLPSRDEHNRERAKALTKAIGTRLTDKEVIPVEWVEELNDLRENVPQAKLPEPKAFVDEVRIVTTMADILPGETVHVGHGPNPPALCGISGVYTATYYVGLSNCEICRHESVRRATS